MRQENKGERALDSARAKATNAAVCLVELVNLLERDSGNLLDNELRDSLATLDVNAFRRIKINGADLELTTIVGIDETWSVSHGETLSKGEAAAGLHKARKTLRNGNGKAGTNELSLEGGKCDVFIRA